MRRHPVWTVFGGMSALLLLLAAIAIWVNFGQGWPAIRVSRETTHITEPLTPNGMPDYVAALNERMGAGVTPESNAVVLLLQAVGPRLHGAETKPGDQLADELGVPRLPASGDYLLSQEQYLNSILSGLDFQERQRREKRFGEELDAATSNPWTAEQYPELQEWIARNEKPIAIVHEAVLRPKYFHPIIPIRDEISDGLLIGSPYLIGEPSAELGRLLLIRATQRLNEGRFHEAQADLMAIHRLARHLASGLITWNRFYGQKIEAYASLGDVQLAMHPDLPADLAKEYRKELERMPPVTTIDQWRETVDFAQRLTVLDFIVAFHRKPSAAMPFGVRGSVPPFLLDCNPQLTVDLNETLLVVNKAFDQAAALVGEHDDSRRTLLSENLQSAAKSRYHHLRQLEKRPFPIFLAGPRGRGAIFAEYLVQERLRLAGHKVDRSRIDATRRQRSILALALGEYRARQGRFPQSLSELVPDYLEETPIDLFSGKEWIYRVSDDGQSLLTYSIGENRVDDNGQRPTESTGPTRDDLPIRAGGLFSDDQFIESGVE